MAGIMYLYLSLKEIPKLVEEQQNKKPKKKLAPILRSVIEVGFIVFLFYSNLLMGEFTRSKIQQGADLLKAIENIFTITNFIMAITLAVIGHLGFEFVRKRL
jgi:hypothetical protein